MTNVLHLDFETRSAADLRKCGADVYAKHPSTDILCVGFAFGDDAIALWHPGKVSPALARALDYVERGGLVIAHNAPFELAIWNAVGVKKYRWPELKPEQMVCTMAMAYAMALPGSLEKAAAAVGIEQQKDMAGSRVMMQLAQPRDVLPCAKHSGEDCLFCNGSGETITWWGKSEFPEKYERVYAYCKQDVEVERPLHKRLMSLSPAETKVWLLDQRINQRGISIDLKAVKSAIKLVEAEEDRLNAEMRAVTDKGVATCTATGQLKDWLKYRGVETEGVAKADVLALLEKSDLPTDVRRALSLRQEAAKSSTKKLVAMLARASSDGRIRGTTQYHGAGTGRFAGRGIQVQNFPRPNLKQNEIEEILELLSEVETN